MAKRKSGRSSPLRFTRYGETPNAGPHLIKTELPAICTTTQRFVPWLLLPFSSLGPHPDFRKYLLLSLICINTPFAGRRCRVQAYGCRHGPTFRPSAVLLECKRTFRSTCVMTFHCIKAAGNRDYAEMVVSRSAKSVQSWLVLINEGPPCSGRHASLKILPSTSHCVSQRQPLSLFPWIYRLNKS